jgi:hypothetical protein
MGIPNSMIVDDWFTAAQQLKQVLAQNESDVQRI